MPVPATNAHSQKPDAVDLSHHLSLLSRSRNPSPLKEMFKYLAVPGMLSLGGGLPHPSVFAIKQLGFSALQPTSPLDPAKPGFQASVDEFAVSQTKQAGSAVDLISSLQYGEATGLLSLRQFGREFIQRVFPPAYNDWEILLNSGNTDGWSKVVDLILNPGDYLLCEEYTFASAQQYWAPMGCKGVPIKLDGQGLRADHLEETLANWDVTHPGVKRPTLMYVVTVGQNPSGGTMSEERKRQIYDVCVKYDVIICEDDPYSYLQYPDFEFGKEQATPSASPVEFAKSLVPSFLQLDFQGRVIRLETFSKTLAPGCRLGFFVCNPLFSERLLRDTEVRSMQPSGFSQAVIAELMGHWGTEGYLQWLSSLRDNYLTRRNWLLESFAKHFDLIPASSAKVVGAEGVVAFAKGKGGEIEATPLFSFVPPTGGMFVWIKMYLSANEEFKTLAKDSGVKDPEASFMELIWRRLAENKVLLSPGDYFAPWQGADKATTKDAGREAGVGHFRLAFSYGSRDEMDEAINRVGQTIAASWAA
ncbi:PLP-dependent transferase [Meredithblackwellia eburnea MCA 4105]